MLIVFFFTMIVSNFFYLKHFYLNNPIIIFLLSLIMAGLMTFFFLILCFIIMSFLPPNHPFKGFVIRSLSRFIKVFLRIKVIVKNKHLLPLKENIVIYANHKSYTDAFLIAISLPRTLTFAPKDKFCFPFLTKWLLNLAFYSSDCMVVSRESIRKTAKNLSKAIPKIKSGLALVVFPEGGMTDVDNERVTPLFGGAFKIALKSQASIVPLTIKGASKIKNYFWWQKKRVEIILHPVLKYDDYRCDTIKQIALNVENKINSGLE
ncbi:putative 1-acyl-sn-glycerol-3-phosphate acyltransferase [Strawberry lethal yellows phytoplasma (CPA) str. NZSb11]|uniref:Putative 1-acyl-sn-glycerol-3-phosphate acyltransferase n=1 Tax=Strawberry lethal yellows phytoplasma (CPA) str. NZSb11 TaxID=980422 RepID=R4RL25_PHYAS|nr:putative 1-acyl-sn-glycerol-3-phosphate acyltransferase [Strawberry lethal yellows phytoplasma (CPA) str. NZSb11]